MSMPCKRKAEESSVCIYGECISLGAYIGLAYCTVLILGFSKTGAGLDGLGLSTFSFVYLLIAISDDDLFL
jgi:hypothetical protein